MEHEIIMEHKINMSIEEYMLVKNILNIRRKIFDARKVEFMDMLIAVILEEIQEEYNLL